MFFLGSRVTITLTRTTGFMRLNIPIICLHQCILHFFAHHALGRRPPLSSGLFRQDTDPGLIRWSVMVRHRSVFCVAVIYFVHQNVVSDHTISDQNLSCVFEIFL